MRNLLLTLLAIAPLMAMAQVEWSTTEYDFGTFHEKDGVKRGIVTMYNRGDKPVVIMRVKPSCGCTAAGFSDGEVAPGDSTTIWIDYDPAGRPGPFRKNVKVYIDDFATKPHQIDFKGTVIATPETVAMLYPYEAGPLQISTNRLTVGSTRKGVSHSMFINVYNVSDYPVTPEWDTRDLPITVAASSETVQPGELMTFSVYYNSRQDDVMGAVSREFLIYPEGKRGGNPVTIFFDTDLQPDPLAYPAKDMDKAPIVVMKKDITDLGRLKNGVKEVKVEFEVQNAGKSVLHISRVYCEDKAAVVKRIPMRVNSGKKDKITVMLNPELLPEGPFHLKIEVCSDDPVHPFVTHRIVGIK